MAILQLGGSAGTRVEIGDRLIAAAKTVDVKPVARSFARFKSAHAALKKHEREARDAEKQLRAAQGDLAAADLEIDRAVEVLASALVGEGAPRLRPFTAIGETQSPSAIRKMKLAAQAKLCLALGKRLERHPAQRVKRAAKALRDAATKVQAAQKPITARQGAFSEAIAIRLGPEQDWENAFVALKDAARAARHDGGARIFSTLFEKTAAARPRPKRQTPASPAEPVAPS
ncbi:MAG: hypothetical protein M3Y87_33815 [Myxococcota bacterium]|nr:hypothetical protein [Myxococcota bacterium]